MADSLVKRNIRLFGIPYQFSSAVDPRIEGVSNTIGTNYMKNIILDAPIATIVPGVPKYLPGASDKTIKSHAIIEAMGGEYASLLNNITGNDSSNFRYYDFESKYVEYMKYVNILCRTTANFLGVTDPQYAIDGKSLDKYDWKNYRMSNNNDAYRSTVSAFWDSISSALSSIGMGGSSEMVDDSGFGASDSIFQSYNFVQFYVDPSVSCADSIGNDTSESKIKGLLDGTSDWMKEFSFITQSAGADYMSDLQQFVGDSGEALANGIATTNFPVPDGIRTVLGNFFSLAGNVIKGENIIIPNIYQSSSYSKSYSLTVHLRTPYKSKYGYYMDVVAPLMHLLALALPRQATANSYTSPFLVKIYVPGLFNCNLGIVKSISISKNSESFSVDGYPCDIDVELEIEDLYSDLSMTPASSPVLFVNNTSLIEYLANTCGLSLITPNLSRKFEMFTDSVINAITGIPSTIMGTVTERIDAVVASFLSLT